MKVKIKKLENDNILMTVSSGLEIVVNRLELSMIIDACKKYIENDKEYIKNETGSIETSGECYPRGAKNMVVGDGFLDMQKKSDGSITTEGGLHIAQPKEKPKKLKYLCRECKDPCKLKVYGGDFIPFGCPFGYGGANWE